MSLTKLAGAWQKLRFGTRARALKTSPSALGARGERGSPGSLRPFEARTFSIKNYYMNVAYTRSRQIARKISLGIFGVF